MKVATLENFQKMTDRHGVPAPIAVKVYNELLTHYSEEHRHYHNLAHIERMLELHSQVCPIDDELGLAIWFHDVICDPKTDHNERKSAHFFSKRFSHFLWAEFVSEVQRLIMATDPLLPHLETNREKLIVDIDRNILGSPSEQYYEYSKAIRLEYSHVSDTDYKEGRSQFLQRFLSQQIFTTKHFSYLEDQARTNISEELEELQE